MSLFKLTAAAVAVAAGIGAASAATVRNSRGTFIQDRHGTWHQYVRVSQRRDFANVNAGANHAIRPQHDWLPQFHNSSGFDGHDEYDYGTSSQYAMVPQSRYVGAFYTQEGYSPLAYGSGGPSYPNSGILSEH
jgi:hypothetical protein